MTARPVIVGAGGAVPTAPARIDIWADLMAARGGRVNLLRLWRMQATMPALTLITGLAVPRPGTAPALHLAESR